MKSYTFGIIVGVPAALAIAALFLGYWPVTVGLAIVMVARLVSRGMQSSGPRPTE